MNRSETASRKHRDIHDVKQSAKMMPCITGEIAFRQHVSKLVFGVNIFDVDLLIQIDSVKQPIQRDSVGSGLVSHRRTSALNDHFGESVIFFKNVQLVFEVRRFCACDNVFHIEQLTNFTVAVYFCFSLGVGVDAWGFIARSRFLDTRFSTSSRIRFLDACVLVGVAILQSPDPRDQEWGHTIHARTSIQRNNFRLS